MERRVVIAGALGAGCALLVLFVLAASRVAGSPTGTRSESPSASPSGAVGQGEADVLAQREGYALWGRQPDGSPVRWDPCEPIRWVLDADEAPDRARQALSQAMARITAVSGLRFAYAGGSDEQPSPDRPLTTSTPDGTRWAPVLISWVPADSIALPLTDTERGVAVPVAVREDGTRVFVTGQVVFNADKTLLPMFEDRHASWGAVVLHELMHLVGLDHVDDPAQLMAPTPGFGQVRFGDGDRAGLAAVGGDGGCVDVPEPRELPVSYDRSRS